MKKEEYIRRHGKAAYSRKLELGRQWKKVNHDKNRETIRRWRKTNPEKVAEHNRKWKEANPEKVSEIGHKWREANPEKVLSHSRDECRKKGKMYPRKLKYRTTGLQGEREKIRMRHGNRWRKYKRIIAPDSQIHHQWVPETSDYRGVALVEKARHQHGIIDVIQILKGKITLFTEKEIRDQEWEHDNE